MYKESETLLILTSKEPEVQVCTLVPHSSNKEAHVLHPICLCRVLGATEPTCALFCCSAALSFCAHLLLAVVISKPSKETWMLIKSTWLRYLFRKVCRHEGGFECSFFIQLLPKKKSVSGWFHPSVVIHALYINGVKMYFQLNMLALQDEFF